MSHSHNSSGPPDLDPLLHQISQAHGSPDDESLTEAAIIASVNYLQKLPQEIHWLCNSSPLLTVVVQAIQLWGYGEPPAQATLAKFKPLLAKALARCSDCGVEWHSGFRRELRRVFMEVYSYDEESTSDFYSVLEEWDGDRVQAALENALQVIERIPMPWKHIEVKCPLVECLAEPTLLLTEERLRPWKKLFLGLEKMPTGVGDKWMPGAMVLLFDSDTRIREFGQLMFKKREQKIRNAEFDSSLRKALEILVKRDSQKVNEGDFQGATHFWLALNTIFRSSERSLIERTLVSPPFDLLSLLFYQLSTAGPHLPAMLTVLCFLLQVFSTGIWQRTSCTASNLIDLIFSNSSFENILLHPETLPSDSDLSVLLDWLPRFIATQSDHGKVQVAAKILYFCFEKFNHTQFPEMSRIFCLSQGMRLIRGIIEDAVADNELVDRDVDLALKLEVIQVVDKYSTLIMRTASTGDPWASRVLGLRLQMDCLLLEGELKELIKPDIYRGRVIPTLKLAEMWDVIGERSWTEDDTNLIRAVLSGVGRGVILDLLESHKFESKDAERVKRYSKATFELQRHLITLFTQMSDIRPRIMRSILEDRDTCTSVVAHLFNAKRQNLEKSDLDMLKTSYDVTEKYDLWRQLLLVSFEPALNGVCRVSRQILRMQKTFPPEKLRPWHRGYLLAYVSKVIRQSMQIVDILCSGRSGILTTTSVLSQSDSNAAILQSFWREFWNILNIAFSSATTWAESEDKDVMKNFLRDVLEGASLLFDALKSFDASISGSQFDDISPAKASNLQHSLLKDVQAPLQSLSKWLALNVEELRESTLTLASRMLKQFARAEVQVKEETLVQYYRLAHGKKKNNMSEEQRERLLFVLSEHDVEADTRRAVEAMAATRAAGRATPSTTAGVAPDLAKTKPREVINLSDGTDFISDYLSDSELNAFMDRLDKKTPSTKSGVLQQKKLDFSKSSLKPPNSTGMTRTTSLPSKSALSNKKTPAPAGISGTGLGGMAQLRAEYMTDRQNFLMAAKKHRAPVEAPKTNAFGKPLDETGKVIEPPRPPPKKVEESSSSESESDDEVGGLFSIAKENKSPPKIRKTEQRKVQLLNEPIRSRISMQARDREQGRVPSERNIRARLQPDTKPLITRVLGWMPEHTGQFPPGMTQGDFKKVATVFPSSNKYEETYEPLLMLECWQHILQAKMESLAESFDFTIENRQRTDEYVDLFVTMKPMTYANINLMEPDLVIISNGRGRGGKECFALVKGHKKKWDSVELSLRCIPSRDLAALLVPKAAMFGTKLFSLTPILREFGALKGLPYYDLVEEILAARPSMPVKPSNYDLKFTMNAYAVNEPQAAAIVGASQSQGFSLIQGPPGTGKTKTILGMVGAFLTGNAKPGATSISIPGQQSSEPPPKPRLLICAPSNAAVDEIVLRLIGGIRNSQGQKYQPNIVRVGRSDNINANVRRVTLDELVDTRLESASSNKDKDKTEEAALRAELNKVLELRNTKGAEYDRARELGEGNASILANELKELNAQKNRIGAQLDDQKEKRLALVRDTDISRRQTIAAILDEADVICCTLSGSGHDQLVKMKVNFETVIIDEAAQSIELAALIPLKFGCQRCILVGDPNQLPPTVLSQAAAKFLYEESLFVRMQRNHPKSVYLLSIQYRMSPEISRFPSLKFYDGKLIDGPNMSSVTTREWHRSTLFRPYCFFNVHGGVQERGDRGVSLKNRAEVAIALSIYDRLRQDFGHVDFDGKIGIVTPYKEQLGELMRQFRSRHGHEITDSVDFNTIDGFQGQEKDIIILSCVRATQDAGVGFLKDIRRINVALTRAKSTLFILGNKGALMGNEFWRDLIVDAEKRRVLVDCGPNTFARSTVLPIVKSSPQTTESNVVMPRKGSIKTKVTEQMGELIPLKPKSTARMEAAPVTVGSDVEMRDANESSDSISKTDSDASDIVMLDAFPERPTTTPAAKSSPIANPRPKEKKKKKEKLRLQPDSDKVKDTDSSMQHRLSTSKKSSEKKDSTKLSSKASNGIKIPPPPNAKPIGPPAVKPLKRPAPTDPSGAPTYKRKPAAPQLFITKKKPPTSVAVTGPESGGQKESVKQRLAREMHPPA